MTTATPVDVGAVPLELRERPRWVLWQYEARDGKRTKVPYDAKTDRRASSTKATTWSSFEIAVTAYQRSQRYDGIGFVVVAEDDIVGVDLDHCLTETQEPEDWAALIVGALNSYTEVTPSGAGLRVFCRGQLPSGGRKRGPVEVYDSGRFLTVTGRRLDGTRSTIEARTAELGVVHATYFPAAPVAPSPRPMSRESLALEDQELLRRAESAADGNKFAALWRGDATGYNGDHSGADLALASKLAFWTGGDMAQMDRLFRQSGLMRAKWDERRGSSTYGELTLARAAATTQEHYGERLSSTRLNSGGAEHRNGKIEPPPPEPPVQDPATRERPLPSKQHSELWSAEQYVELFGDRVRYCVESGWYVYRDGAWREDRTGHAQRLAKRMVRQWLRQAASDDEIDKELSAWAVKCHTAAKLKSILQLAQTEARVAITITDFDQQPLLLNVANGTIDLQTGVLRSHSPEDLLTKQCPVAFDPDAQCLRWERFLREVFGDDEQLITYVQRLLGYSLTGLQIYHLLVFLWGAGRNGKTTLLEAINKILSDYARSISSEVLLMSRENGDYNVAQLRGARLAITSETGQHRKVDEARVKLLTGGDTLPARHPYGRPFTFSPTHHTWLMSNHKPTIEGQDRGIWSRVKMIEFPNRFELAPEGVDAQSWQPGPHIRPADPSLPAQLEAEQPGILAWLIRGAVAVLRDGLQEPASVSEATERYREQMDVLGGFLDDCCDIGPYLSDTSARLYGAYKTWCASNGVEPVASNKFGMLLAERGSFVAVKPSTGDRQRRWSGLQARQRNGEDDDR